MTTWSLITVVLVNGILLVWQVIELSRRYRIREKTQPDHDKLWVAIQALKELQTQQIAMLRVLISRQPAVRPMPEVINPPVDRLYEQAIGLAQRGVPADQLVTTFGISQGEAELLAALHHPRN